MGGDFRERYEIGPEIGKGAFGVVYVAREPQSNVPAAIKVLNRQARTIPELFQRFQREARILRAIDHRNIVSLYDCDLEGDPPWIAMELVRGADLLEVIRKEGPLGPEALYRLAVQLTEAVDAFHARGVLHRDLKPTNIRIRAGDGRAMVMDLGLAAMEGATRLTRAGQVLGTIRYMPPDCAGGEEWTPAADLYQVGAILFEAGTGKPYLPGDTFQLAAKSLVAHAREPWPDDSPIPMVMRAAIQRLAALRPEERFESGAAFREALAEGEDPGVDAYGQIVAVEPPPLAPGVLEFLNSGTVVEVSGWGGQGVSWRFRPWHVVLGLALVAGLFYGFMGGR